MEIRYIVSADWGTSRLRLKLVEADATQAVLCQVACDKGVAVLAREAREQGTTLASLCRRTLTRALTDLYAALPCPLTPRFRPTIYISGMASSRIGWKELPYTRLPMRLDASTLHTEQLPDLVLDRANGAWRHKVILISGVRDAADVMRGEETEIVGLFQDVGLRVYADNCLLILPGTHSKHVRIKAAAVESFRTCLTGELYDLLGSQSVLQHSVADVSEPWDSGIPENVRAFLDGVQRGAADGINASLFTVRAKSLLENIQPTEARAILNGVLIGSELTSLCREDLQGCPVLLTAPPYVARLYEKAANALKLGPWHLVPEETAQTSAHRGHLAVHHYLKEQAA
jgi:2-dehydro-3-deoxygalactonokinase